MLSSRKTDKKCFYLARDTNFLSKDNQELSPSFETWGYYASLKNI